MEETKGEGRQHAASAYARAYSATEVPQEPLVLQAYVEAHTSDLRCMCAGAQHLFTGGRDNKLLAFELTALSGVTVQPKAALKLDTWLNALLTVPDESMIVCGCKDAVVYLVKWNAQDDAAAGGGAGDVVDTMKNRTSLSIVGAVTGHAGPICSLSWLSSLTPAGDPLLLSGAWDDTARLTDLKDGKCLYVFENHENNVSVLGLDSMEHAHASGGDGGGGGDNGGGGGSSRCVVTGSTGYAMGDKVEGQQIRVWREKQQDGQPHPVLPSSQPPGSSSSSSSAWSSSTSSTWTVEASYRDHLLGIRDLCRFPSSLPFAFGSCSNDGTVRLWWRHSSKFDRSVHMEVPPLVLGEEGGAFVYSLCWSETNKAIVAGNDDGCLSVWNIDGSLRQTIQQSSCIWCTAAAGGLICSGDSKGNLRVYGTNAALALPEGTGVSQPQKRQRPLQGEGQGQQGQEGEEYISSADRDKYTAGSLPSSTAVAEGGGGGARKSQVSIFQNPASGELEVYRWVKVEDGQTTEKGGWELVGVVAEPVPLRPKHTLDGELYDVIIPVEIDSASKGFLQLSLGVNVGDNADEVSASFCKKHDLPSEYYPQIAEFIRANMG